MTDSRRRKMKPAAAGDEEQSRGGARARTREVERFSAGSFGEAERRPMPRYEAPKGLEGPVREVEGFDETVLAAQRERAGTAHPPSPPDD